MKTAFQKFLEQRKLSPLDFIRSLDDNRPPEPPEGEGPDSEVQTKPDAPIVNPEISDHQNENAPPDIPDGLTPVDVDGDGVWDHYVDADGNIYMVEWVLGENHQGQQVLVLVITYNYQGYTLAYTNGQWSLVGTNADGHQFLQPNIWPHIFPSGGIMFVYEWVNPDPPFQSQYWITTGNPYSSDPPCTWVNPLTGGTQAGGQVYYDPIAGVWVSVFAEGLPTFNVPLVPGGGAGGFSTRPGGYGVGVGMTIPLDQRGPYEGGGLQHRLAWNNFVVWWAETFGGYPPSNMWPTRAGWWDDWSDSHDGPW